MQINLEVERMGKYLISFFFFLLVVIVEMQEEVRAIKVKKKFFLASRWNRNWDFLCSLHPTHTDECRKDTKGSHVSTHEKSIHFNYTKSHNPIFSLSSQSQWSFSFSVAPPCYTNINLSWNCAWLGDANNKKTISNSQVTVNFASTQRLSFSELK